jgi:alanine racemase
MDQFMVDVTDIPKAVLGDEVTLIGADEDARITLEELGGLSGRFNYEFACDLGKRIPRIFVKGGRPVAAFDQFHGLADE